MVQTNSLSSFAFSFLFLTLEIYTVEGIKKNLKNNNIMIIYITTTMGIMLMVLS